MNQNKCFYYFQNIAIIAMVITINACTSSPLRQTSLQPVSQQIRNPGIITLPLEINNVWYRSGDKVFPIPAYSASGNLSINGSAIKFISKDEKS